MDTPAPGQNPLFQRAFEEAGVAMALVALDGRWLHVNRRLCQFSGYDLSELRTRTVQAMTSRGTGEPLDLQLIGQILASDVDNYQVRVPMVQKSGVSIPVLITFSLLRDDAGNPHLFIMQVREVTMNTLESAESLFEMPKALHFVAGHDGLFKRLSRNWSDVLGHSIETLLRQPYLDFVHPDDWERTRQEAARVQNGEEAVLFENRYRHADGTYRWLLWSALPVESEHLIYGIAFDETERKRAAIELETTLEEQRRLYSELDEATARIRELRNGLVKICAWTKRVQIDNRWIPTDEFLSEHLNLKVTHGISEEAAAKYFPDVYNPEHLNDS